VQGVQFVDFSLHPGKGFSLVVGHHGFSGLPTN
jgi:hypothetical protein